jgi:2,3-bisphosphoglycerate-dependent phosphoglycerate mutase
MKKIFVSLFAVLFLFACSAAVSAQKKEMTIILLRHAEKDLSTGAEDPDPLLSTDGMKRAERLVEVVGKYKPRRFFTSGFRRTRLTLTPLAERSLKGYRLPIERYDHRKLDELMSQILASNARTVIVAGHNTTTPALANLLVKENKYKPLAESEYNKIWIIKIKKGKIKTAEVVEY